MWCHLAFFYINFIQLVNILYWKSQLSGRIWFFDVLQHLLIMLNSLLARKNKVFRAEYYLNVLVKVFYSISINQIFSFRTNLIHHVPFWGISTNFLVTAVDEKEFGYVSQKDIRFRCRHLPRIYPRNQSTIEEIQELQPFDKVSKCSTAQYPLPVEHFRFLWPFL